MAYLNDTEKRLLLSALHREKGICKVIDEQKSDGILLAPFVESLERKFYYDRFEKEIGAKAIDEFAERLKPIIDEKIKGWTNSDDLRRWCERSIDEVAEHMKAGEIDG